MTYETSNPICAVSGEEKTEANYCGMNWLRGKDLNLRPLGYEFDLCFAWFHVVPSISMVYPILMALGSSCFGLLLLGSGSTFGTTPPPLSGGEVLPLLSILILWAANPKGISWSRRDTRLAKPRNHRGPQFRIAGCCLPGVLRQTNTEILAQELRRAKNPTTSPLSLLRS